MTIDPDELLREILDTSQSILDGSKPDQGVELASQVQQLNAWLRDSGPLPLIWYLMVEEVQTLRRLSIPLEVILKFLDERLGTDGVHCGSASVRACIEQMKAELGQMQMAGRRTAAGRIK